MEKSLLLLVLVFFVVTNALVDYSDVQALGIACSPRDTCSNTTGRTFFKSSCECDSWCYLFHDCCVDAPSRIRNSTIQEYKGISCLQVEPLQGVYVIKKCNNSWNGSDVVRRKCEDDDDFSDPLMSLPTTDTRTDVTYFNHFCAECNYGSLHTLSFWKIKITCSSLENLHGNITKDFIVRNITRSGSLWGVYHWNESLGDRMFYPCDLSFQLPDSLKPHVRYCRPQVISTCPDDWKREVVKGHCLSYMAVIYIGNQAYRNAHCALCNRISIRNRACDYEGILERKKPSLSFTLLIDVNSSDGDNVGERNPCSSGETYDPFAKICRPLVCALPGQVYRGGRCVSE